MVLSWAQFDRLMSSVLDQLGLRLESGQIDRLYRHYTLLDHWNRHISLTAIRDPEEVVVRHFGESLAVATLIGPGVGAVVDIGSGAGFPGAPIAVCWAGRHVTLVESSGKKGVFLKELVRPEGNLSVFVGRLEEFDGRAEWVTMRGVAAREVAGKVKRVAGKAAVIQSASRSSSAIEDLRMIEVEEHPMPWDPRTTVVVGQVSRETES